jgi:hypothetical protein
VDQLVADVRGPPASSTENRTEAVGAVLLELADADRTAHELKHAISSVRGCVEAALACVRAARNLTQRHWDWREAVRIHTAKIRVDSDCSEQIATATARAGERVAGLLGMYADCARPLEPALGVLTAELAKTDERREAMSQRLPTALASHHKALRRSDRFPCICGIAGGCCAGCNVQLPTVLAQRIQHIGPEICPNCRRILCSDANVLRAIS